MYTGNLIDDLIAAVERAESTTCVEQQESEPETWCAIMPTEVFALEAAPQLAGVA